MNRPDLIREYKRRLIAASPAELRETDIVLTITETVTIQDCGVTLRPMTDEERAAWEVARRISGETLGVSADVAAEKIAARGISKKERG